MGIQSCRLLLPKYSITISFERKFLSAKLKTMNTIRSKVAMLILTRRMMTTRMMMMKKGTGLLGKHQTLICILEGV